MILTWSTKVLSCCLFYFINQLDITNKTNIWRYMMPYWGGLSYHRYLFTCKTTNKGCIIGIASVLVLNENRTRFLHPPHSPLGTETGRYNKFLRHLTNHKLLHWLTKWSWLANSFGMTAWPLAINGGLWNIYTMKPLMKSYLCSVSSELNCLMVVFNISFLTSWPTWPQNLTHARLERISITHLQTMLASENRATDWCDIYNTEKH